MNTKGCFALADDCTGDRRAGTGHPNLGQSLFKVVDNEGLLKEVRLYFKLSGLSDTR